jgi:hypothetical protein
MADARRIPVDLAPSRQARADFASIADDLDFSSPASQPGKRSLGSCCSERWWSGHSSLSARHCFDDGRPHWCRGADLMLDRGRGDGRTLWLRIRRAIEATGSAAGLCPTERGLSYRSSAGRIRRAGGIGLRRAVIFRAVPSRYLGGFRLYLAPLVSRPPLIPCGCYRLQTCGHARSTTSAIHLTGGQKQRTRSAHPHCRAGRAR